MTNSNSHSPKAASKPISKIAKTTGKAKKADPYAAVKSSIMIFSMVGTMAGWLLLLNQETAMPSVNTTVLNSSIFASDETAVEPLPIVDISQLRQVNEVETVEAVTVVARTRSSR